MNHDQLLATIRETFPTAKFDDKEANLGLGSFPEWDSLGNFNLLLRIEETAKIRFNSEQISEIKNVTAIIFALKQLGVYRDT